MFDLTVTKKVTLPTNFIPLGGVKKSPFHIRIGEAFKNGAGFLEFGKFGKRAVVGEEHAVWPH